MSLSLLSVLASVIALSFRTFYLYKLVVSLVLKLSDFNVLLSDLGHTLKQYEDNIENGVGTIQSDHLICLCHLRVKNI